MPPTLYLDPARAVAAYRALTARHEWPRVRYAVKANAHHALLAALARAGAHFAVVSPAELAALDAVGVPGDRIACVTPGPPASLLRACRAANVALYAVDSPWEVRKLAALVPGASALVTLALLPAGRLRYPAARVGIALDALDALLATARGLPVALVGVTIHVGSQCERLAPWRRGVALAALAWQRLEAAGHPPRVLSLGGGLPVAYRRAVPTPDAIAGTVQRALARHFPTPPAEVWWEPGRFLVADAGALAATVLDVQPRSRGGAGALVQVDVGRYHGLPEAALGIRYGYRTERGGPLARCTLCGPLGARHDLLDRAAWLPALAPGDRLWLERAGAYTQGQTAYPEAGAVAVEVVT